MASAQCVNVITSYSIHYTKLYDPWIGKEGSLKMDRSDPKAKIWPVTGEEPSWNLITAMADDAIDWMYRIHQTDPEQPVFIQYVPGSSHAPHHPTSYNFV